MLYQIQYLRAVAVLAVCYFHLVEVLNDNRFQIGNVLHDVGPVGVDLFFVISGFIMARIASTGDVKAGSFLIKRIRRIAPVYWFATLLVFGIALSFPSQLVSTKADPVQLLHSLLFIPNGQSVDSTSPTLVIGWTLNYEMFFYVLVAIAAGILNDRRLITVIVAILGLSLIGLFRNTTNGYVEFYTDPILLEFGFGVLAYHMWSQRNRPMPKAFSVTVIALMIGIIVLTKENYLSDARPLIWGLPAAIIVYAAMSLKFDRESILKQIGDWSYEIYIWHVFAIVGLVKLMSLIAAIGLSTTLIAIAYGALVLFALVAAGIGMNILFSPVRGQKYPSLDDNSKSWRQH